MPHTSDHRPPTRHAASSSLLLPSSFFLPASFLPLRTTVPMLSSLSTLASAAKSIACNLSPPKNTNYSPNPVPHSCFLLPPSASSIFLARMAFSNVVKLANTSKYRKINCLQLVSCEKYKLPAQKRTRSRAHPSSPTSAGPPRPAYTRVLCAGERAPHSSASVARGPGRPDAPRSRSPARVLSRSGAGRRTPSTSPSGWPR